MRKVQKNVYQIDKTEDEKKIMQQQWPNWKVKSALRKRDDSWLNWKRHKSSFK